MTATGMRPIRVLPPQVVARIAAGEVVGRPRAVVKELIDNALDAGARHIEVEIASGGYDLVAVHDDGHGIPARDLPLLFTRHATSKLDGPELHGVTTLGFRGEALASLAAVADITVRTRHGDDAVGARARANHGQRSAEQPTARQPGTSVEVRELFRHVPVRRRAADPAAEAAAIRRLVAHFALVHSAVSFALRDGNRELLRPAADNVRQRFAEIHVDDVARHMLEIGRIDCSGATISGLVSGPGAHRGRRDEMVVSVNGRLCEVSELSQAVERAYAQVLPRRRYPYVVLLVELPSSLVDANIHPAKEQVMLQGGRAVAAGLERELRALVGRAAHVPDDRFQLALQAADLPGLRAMERRAGYESGGWGGFVVESGSLPRLRVVGQLDDTLIVCESDLGTLLVDQHRAHERVIFERLLTSESVRLDPPVHVSLPVGLDVAEIAEQLYSTGWRIAALDGATCIVQAHPREFTPDDLPAILHQHLHDDAESLLASAACHAAIRKRRPLSPGAAVELLEALTGTTTPTTCPHGQPIVLRLDRGFLEKQFAWR